MTPSPFGRRGTLGAILGALAWPAAAHDGPTHRVEAADGDAGVVRLHGPLPDPRVTDAARQRRRLASEVIGDRVVAIDFVLTGCAALCNVVSASMAGAQGILGERLRREAGLLSIALDPFGDTPDELAAYGARFGAGPGWSLVNVPAPALDAVVRRLGGPQPGADHAPLVVVFDPQRGELRRLMGVPAPERIAATIAAALDARRRPA